MIGILQSSQTAIAAQMRPWYTGCVFPHGKGNRDVRVYLMTDNPIKAEALGNRLHEWGLPRIGRLLEPPRLETAMVFNPFMPPEWDERLQMKVPKFIKFGGDALLLETAEREDVFRFAKWMIEKNVAIEQAQPAKPKSLTDLAKWTKRRST